MEREMISVGAKLRNAVSLLRTFLLIVLFASSASGRVDPTVVARDAIFSEYNNLRDAFGVHAILNCLSSDSKRIVENQLEGTTGDIALFAYAKSFVKEHLCPSFSGRGILPEDGSIVRIVVFDREYAAVFIESSASDLEKLILINEGGFSNMEWRFVLNEY